MPVDVAFQILKKQYLKNQMKMKGMEIFHSFGWPTTISLLLVVTTVTLKQQLWLPGFEQYVLFGKIRRNNSE